MRINLVESLLATSEKFPDKRAVVDERESLTFRELAEKGFCVSRRIAQQSPGVNRPILIYMEKSCAALAGIVGVLMSGNCYCPIDVSSPQGRLQSMLRTLQAQLALTTRSLKPKLLEAGMPEEQIVLFEEIPCAPAGRLREEVREKISGLIDTDPAYVIFTSGSTGDPKGVTISHRGVIDYISWARECYDVTEKEVLGNQSPLFFDNSTLDLHLCLSTAATLHFIPEICYRFPVRLMEYLEKEKITFIFWVPSVLVTVANFDLMKQRVPAHLRKVLFAGEVMPAKQLRYWMEKLPQALFSNLYGPTEITVDCTYYNVPADFSAEAVPIGIPCRNTDILILTEDNRGAAPLELGELCVRGSSLALGYWNNPGETMRAFCQNPLNTFYNDPIYRTGDLVYRTPEGLIFFVGRKDSQIKHHGYRIELGEIEAAAQALGAVAQCSATYDKERQEIHLFLEMIEGGDLSVVQSELAQRLPRYMVPNRYHLLEKLPLTPNGKLDRRQLQNMTCGKGC